MGLNITNSVYLKSERVKQARLINIFKHGSKIVSFALLYPFTKRFSMDLKKGTIFSAVLAANGRGLIRFKKEKRLRSEIFELRSSGETCLCADRNSRGDILASNMIVGE